MEKIVSLLSYIIMNDFVINFALRYTEFFFTA